MKRTSVLACLIFSAVILSTHAIAQVTGPVLDIPDQIPAESGLTVTVPVNYTANGNSISSMIFSVDFDQTLLSFDPADSNFDTIPDSITINPQISPFVFSIGISFDPGDTDGELDFNFSDISPPLAALPEGVLLSITFNAGNPPLPSEASVNFSQDPGASFGNTAGQSVAGIANNGSIFISPGQSSTEIDCFDGIDNDGDGMMDCADSDCTGVSDGVCTTGQPGICSTGILRCQGGTEMCVPDNEPQLEVCDNLDNDCDGTVDEDLMRATTCGAGECAGNSGMETCSSGVWGSDTCDPFAGAVTEGPEGDQTCGDTLDNDCDGQTDDSDSDCNGVIFTLPPPVNQKLGIPDSVFNNLDEQGCRECHGNPDIVPLPTNVNRHHLRYGLPIQAGFCSINTSQTCVGDEQCSTNICSLTGTACASDLDCLDVEQCGETCVGDSSAPYGPAADGTYECTTCHSVDPENGSFVIAAVRDCLQCHIQIFGEASVHHLTAKAQSQDCQICHGDVVNNIGDGHYISSGPTSDVTPAPSGGEGVPFNSEGNGAGGCNYCHSTGTGELGSVLPGIVDQDPFIGPFGPVEVYTSAETHHSTGLGTYDDRQCLWCHNIDNLGEAPIRRCEGCHGLESLHNIAIDSDDPGTEFIPNTENPGWSHIGNNDDCWGCHGFGASSTALYSGPTVPYIQSADKTQIYAGTDTQITLAGKNFQNTMDTTTWTSNVALTAVDGAIIELTPDAVSTASLTFTVPALTAPGNYHVRAVKADKQSNPYVISIIPDVAITYMKCDTKTRLLTINGTNFGEQYTGAEEHLNVEVDGTVTIINSWDATKITVPVADCRLKPVAKVKALFGAEELACDKGCVQKKRRRRR